MKREMNIVLLTATVTPNVGDHLVVADPHLRLQQYQETAKHWYRALAGSGFHLAVVETSGAGKNDLLSGLSRSERSSVAFHSYSPSPSEIGRGKGAIEMAAIQHAITESIGLDSGSTLYKCTGRLPLLNVARCIGELERGSVRARMTLDRSSADTRLIGATVQEWKNLLFNTAGLVDDAHGIYFERVVASRIASALALGRCRLNRFPVRPIFGGISGTSGRRYSPRLSQARHFLLHPMELVMVKVAAHKQV
jgi:hypothetical protein